MGQRAIRSWISRHSYHSAEQTVKNKKLEDRVVGLGELQENHPSGPIRRPGHEERLKRWANSFQNIIGKTRRSGQLHLPAEVLKRLGAQIHHHALSRQVMAPGFHTGVLNVFGKLRKHKRLVE